MSMKNTNIKFKCIIFFLIFFNFFQIYLSSTCTFINPSAGNQKYDLEPLSQAKISYSILSGSFYLVYNFCNVTITECSSAGTSIACQVSGSTIHSSGDLSKGQIVTYGTNGMTLQYTTEKLGIADCFAGGNIRITYINLSCKPGVDMEPNGPSNESPLCKYNVNMFTKYVCRTCPLDCSGRGSCGPYDGLCTCSNQANGDGCENSLVYISSSDSVPESGGIVTMYGYFGNISSSAIIYIGGLECTDPKVNQTDNWTTLKCLLGPGEGERSITFQDNSISAIGYNSFRYTPPIFTCLNDCSGNGDCNTASGKCNCSDGYSGYDCSASPNNNNNGNPNSSTNVGGNGVSTIGNQITNYAINIYSLVEFDFNSNKVKEHILHNKWNLTSTNTTSTGIISYFSQPIEESDCTVEYTVEEVKTNSKSFSFAGQNFNVDPNSIKITILINQYEFTSSLNYLQLRIVSTVGEESVTDCNEQDTDINTSGINPDQSSNYITISKDSKIFYGRFLNVMLSNNRTSYLSTSIISKNSTSLLIGLTMPHCNEQCLIDPDFSVLVSSDYKTDCTDSEKKWFLPVVIVAPTVGAALIVVVSAILYRKYRVHLKVLAAAIKPAKLANVNN